MKKFLLATVALSALAMAAPASAADLSYPVKAPVAVVPAFTWTGFYVGGNIGYAFSATNGWSSSDWAETYDYDEWDRSWTEPDENQRGYYTNFSEYGFEEYGFAADKQEGFFGGGQIGYNYQFSNNVVIGVEADIQFGSVKGSGSGFSAYENTLRGDYFEEGGEFGEYIDSFLEYEESGDLINVSSKLEYFGTVRARIGYAVDRFLPYITGGLAYGRNKVSVSGGGYWIEEEYEFEGLGQDPTLQDLVYSEEGEWSYTTNSVKQNYFGWTIGAGFEYALTDNWTLKAEYLYVDLGSKTYNVNWTESWTENGTPYTNSGTDSFSIEQKFHTAKIGVNYKF